MRACRWPSDRKRRRRVGVPDEIDFKTKPEIALAQIRWACEAGLPRGAVLMDAGYGVDTDLRTSITTLGLRYVAGIRSHTTVWAPGTGPRPPKKWSGQGRPPKLLRRDEKHKTGLGQGACVGPANACLAHDHMAGTHPAEAILAIRPYARSCRTSGLLARRQSAGGVAVD
jgi:DDE superfamily endonuclease